MKTTRMQTPHATGLWAGFLLLALTPLLGCGEVVAFPTLERTPPTVSSTTPEASATGVMPNATISATFSEAMDPATISNTTFALFRGTTEVDGEVSYIGVTAIFNPAAPLLPTTEYTATIASDVSDVAGNMMARDYTWTFVTGTVPDTTLPQITATVPEIGTINVGVTSSISATFSEAMDPATISNATFELYLGTTRIPGVVTYSDVTATFNPTTELPGSSTYVARIHREASDLAGNRIAQDYVWSFTTGLTPDTTAPMVTETSPDRDVTGVPFASAITATFSEPMAMGTISSATFIVQRSGVTVDGNVTYAGRTATFVPLVPLAPTATYDVRIERDATDLAGNRLAENYTWTFMTGAIPDTTRPTVVETMPEHGDVGFARTSNLIVVFSEPMRASTIDVTTFTLRRLGELIPGTVSYSGVTATFNPTDSLGVNTTYSASIAVEAEDLSGNTLAREYDWTFRTGATVDATRPNVVLTAPNDDDVDVARNVNLLITFDEAVDPSTITNTNFMLFDGSTRIEGTVHAIGNTAVFDPNAPLDEDTEYTATVTSDVRDLAGNGLVSDYVWNFTTGATLDDIAPTVTLTNPLDLATNVAIDALVHATFSEAMDPLTVDATSFTLTDPEGELVLGVVRYDALTRIATFTPDSELLENTLYTATITTHATDLAGTPVEADFEWTLRTGELLSTLGAGIDLRTLSTFVAVAGAGLTNSNSSGTTTLNGDVGLSPSGSCLGDGVLCTLNNPVINGTLYANDPEGVAAQAKVDLIAAYEDGMSRPPGETVNDITGRTLAPGVYTSASTMSIAVGGTLTLDGQGDANAVWIFQIGSSLTVNNNARVLLINGARAKNVFWAISASSTLGSEVSFQGTVLAGASNSVGTDSVVVGRLLCRDGAITLLSNTITLPPL